MKQVLYILVLMIVSFGCRQKEVNLLHLESIDYTCTNGWGSTYSIKIDSLGNIYILVEEFGKEKSFTQACLSTNEIDSLSALVKKIHSENLDTLYKRNCADCGFFYLIIYKGSNSVKLFVEDVDNEDESLIDILYLTNYLNQLKQQVVIKRDSVKFESKTRDFNPVPPPSLGN